MRKTFRFIRSADGFSLELTSGSKRRLWFVPKGPSLDPSHRHIALPLEIDTDVPGENWDVGTWKDAAAADLEHSTHFELLLKGSKLHGRWQLGQSPSGNWTFIKQRDDFAIAGADVHAIDVAFASLPATSAAASYTTGSMAPKLAFVPLALASPADAAPDGADWIHEVKLDGYRIEAIIDRESVRLVSRNEKNWTSRFPTVVEGLRAMKLGSAILDGEVVALDERGVSSFQQLQQSFDSPASPSLRYFVFDILNIEGQSLLAQPLGTRLELLDEILRRAPGNPVVRPTARYNPSKGNVVEQARKAGEEGVISKRIDARYIAGRGKTWLKIKCGKRQEFVIVGYTDPQGSRSGFGSLLLAICENGKYQYAGRVGTGFDTRLLDSMYRRLRALETPVNPLSATPPGTSLRTIHWVTPTLVAEVAFAEWTIDGVLRHPSFKGLREDKRPEQVRRES